MARNVKKKDQPPVEPQYYSEIVLDEAEIIEAMSKYLLANGYVVHGIRLENDEESGEVLMRISTRVPKTLMRVSETENTLAAPPPPPEEKKSE